jgi:hypothetical protein
MKGKMPAGLKRYWASKRRGNSRYNKSTRKKGGAMSRRRKAKMTIPLGIVAGFIPAINDARVNSSNFGGIGNSAMHTAAGLIGWDTVTNKWVGLTQMKAAGAGGVLIGFAAHYIASKMGVNRALGRAGVPFIRI